MNLDHTTDALGKLFDVLRCVVEVEARTVRGGDAEAPHQRLAAVMARTDGDRVEIEELRDVVRVHALDVEADDAGTPVGRRTIERHAGNLAELLERVGGERMLVLLDRVESDRLEIVDRRAEADGFGHGRRPRLELRRQLAPGRGL